MHKPINQSESLELQEGYFQDDPSRVIRGSVLGHGICGGQIIQEELTQYGPRSTPRKASKHSLSHLGTRASDGYHGQKLGAIAYVRYLIRGAAEPRRMPIPSLWGPP